MDVRQCTRCGETKPLCDFHRRADSASGYRHACKQCDRIRKAEWQRAHPDKVSQQNARWRAAHPQQVKANNARSRWRSRYKPKSQNPGPTPEPQSAALSIARFFLDPPPVLEQFNPAKHRRYSPLMGKS
jgi:hypothetical protein